MSNITGEEGSFSSGNTGEEVHQLEINHKNQLKNHFHGSNNSAVLPATAASSGNSNDGSSHNQQPAVKKKRNLPGTPDPNAEVVALSPTTLMATNRFVCEICNKGFQRDQNLQLHRRGHNLPWKLRQRASAEVKKRVYICPEPSCVHHNPARALGDLTGIKKHFSRKHGEKKWKCDKCSKKYAVQSDWKAHQKTCGTREYKCDCGTIFSRRDSFITHRAFCDALAEENNKVNQGLAMTNTNLHTQILAGDHHQLIPSMPLSSTTTNTTTTSEFKSLINPQDLMPLPFKSTTTSGMFSTASGSLFGGPSRATTSSGLQLCSTNTAPSAGANYLLDGGKGSACGAAHMSATALLQKAAQIGATASNSTMHSPMMHKTSFGNSNNSNMALMASPDHHQQHHSYAYHDHQTSMAGINGTGGLGNNNSIINNNPLLINNKISPVQEMSQMFGHANNTNNNNNSNGPVAGTDHVAMMYGQVFVGGNSDPNQQGQALMKTSTTSAEQENQHIINNNSGTNSRSPLGPSRLGGGGDRIVVDFLGIGESRIGSGGLHEQQRLDHLEAMRQHQQQQQRLHPIMGTSVDNGPFHADGFH